MMEFNHGFDENGIEVTHHMPDDGSGVYAKGVFIPAGKSLQNHSHTFTHKSIIAFGYVSVSYDGQKPVRVHGPAVLTIKQGVQHQVTALTDSYWFCIHATDETDAAYIDSALVSRPVARPIIIGDGVIPEAAALRDVQAAMPGRADVVLLAHVASVLKQPIRQDAIIYNFEPLYDGARSLRPDLGYLNLMRQHEVWDYQRRNVAYLCAHGIDAKHVPYRYSPALERPAIAEKSIDVLFVGSMSDRRRAILNELGAVCQVEVVKNCYGQQLDELIAAARVVLNVHFTDAPHPLEVVRLNYLMANGCAVVSERGWDDEENAEYEAGVYFTDDPVKACQDVLAGDWAGLGARGQTLIRSMPMKVPR